MAVTSGACATAGPRTLADRFIVPGEPLVDLSVPASPAGPAGPERGVPAAPPPVPPAHTPRSVSGASTLEATSPLLRDRLATLARTHTPAAYLDVAAAYRHHQVYDRAFDYLAEGLASHPRDAALHAALAAAWRDWGLPERGLRPAHLAVHYAPASAAAWTTLGTVLWDLGDHTAALEALERAAVLAPDAHYARANRCTALAALGAPAAARACAAAPSLGARPPQP